MDTIELIRRIQRATNCTLAELAAAIGVSYETMRSYSSGRLTPGAVMRSRMEAIYGETQNPAITRRWGWKEVIVAGGVIGLIATVLFKDKK